MKIAITDIKIPRGRRELRGVDDLAASIAVVGLLNPITITKARRLVAGYHRIVACKKLGLDTIEARVIDVDDLTAELAEIDENLVRNDLTVLERGEQMARRKKVYLALYPETKQGTAGGKAGGRGREKIANETVSFAIDTAKKTGTSRRTVEHDVQIGSLPEPVRQALRGTEAADDKRGLLALARVKDEKTQAKVARAVGAGKAKTINDALRAQRLVDRHRRNAELAAQNKELPAADRRFAVICADPPWQYEHAISVSREIEEHYPTMTTDAICALPVADKAAATDCVLFLWVPPSLLVDGLRVQQAWGFDHRTAMAWDKVTVGPGYWVRQQMELLLIGVRGRPPTPEPRNRPGSIIPFKRGRHSVKPSIFYDVIERMFPGASRLELFARCARPDWDRWGNQA